MKTDYSKGYFFNTELRADLTETLMCYRNAEIRSFIITKDGGKRVDIGPAVIAATFPKHGGNMLLHVEGDISLKAMMRLVSGFADICAENEGNEIEFNICEDGSGIAKLMVCELWNEFEETLEMKEECKNEKLSDET